jgi:hypothetical protein
VDGDPARGAGRALHLAGHGRCRCGDALTAITAAALRTSGVRR